MHVSVWRWLLRSGAGGVSARPKQLVVSPVVVATERWWFLLPLFEQAGVEALIRPDPLVIVCQALEAGRTVFLIETDKIPEDHLLQQAVRFPGARLHLLTPPDLTPLACAQWVASLCL